jgi:hypothetical protein
VKILLRKTHVSGHSSRIALTIPTKIFRWLVQGTTDSMTMSKGTTFPLVLEALFAVKHGDVMRHSLFGFLFIGLVPFIILCGAHVTLLPYCLEKMWNIQSVI